MKPLRRQTLVEQTAEHLHEGFRHGRWGGKLPGVLRLSRDLGVSRDTVRGSLHLLEKHGVLKAGGPGRCRVIVPRRRRDADRRTLRVGVLLHTSLNRDNWHSQEVILSVKHGVEVAGHACAICSKSIEDLGNHQSRIARVVREAKADAWIVYSGTRDVLEWFASQPIPVLAFGGRSQGLPIACTRTDINQAMSDAVDALVARGHRRIVLVSTTVWRKPTLNLGSQAFMDRLQHHHLKASPEFNVPEWSETGEGLGDLLGALFYATPPTALLLNEPTFALPVLTFLAGRDLRVPGDVSVVNLVPDPLLALYRPALAHFEWPLSPHVHRIVRWVEAVARGTADTQTITCHARFIPAGTIGPGGK